MKKKLAKIIKPTNEFSQKDQFTIVLEDLRSQFKVFGEGLMDVNRKLDSGLGDVNRKLDNHSKILNSHTEMIGQILLDLAETRTEMKQKIDRQEFARLEKRVIMLERRSK